MELLYSKKRVRLHSWNFLLASVCVHSLYGICTQALYRQCVYNLRCIYTIIEDKEYGEFFEGGLSIKEASVPSVWELQGEDNISQGGPVREQNKKLNIRHQ